MSIIKEYQEKEDKDWTDDADIVKHLTGIHSTDTNVSEDFVLFQATDEQKAFIREQSKVADSIADYMADKQTGRETAQSIIRECKTIAILERNKPQNWFVEHLIKRNTEEPIDEQKGKLAGMIDNIFGEKEKQ